MVLTVGLKGLVFNLSGKRIEAVEDKVPWKNLDNEQINDTL